MSSKLASKLRFLRDPKVYKAGPSFNVIIEEQPWSLSTSVGLFFGYGSRFENRKHLGLTHLAEHLFFKGTTRLSAEDISLAIERSGGEMNAYTDRELTCFYAYAPRDRSELALDLLFEMVFDARFDAEDFEKEKRVVVQELLSTEDSPEEVFWDKFFEMPWNQHPLGRPIGGFADEVKNFQYDQLIYELEEHFFRAPFTLVISGAVNPASIMKQVRILMQKSKNFVWGKIAFTKPRRRAPKKKPQTGRSMFPKSRVIHHAGANQVQVSFCYPGVSLKDRNEVLYSGLSSLVGLGSSSMLYRELRENRALVYSVSFQAFGFSDTGLMTGYFMADEKNYLEALSVCGEVMRHCAKKLTADDEDFISSSLRGALMLNFEGSFSRMENLGRQYLLMDQVLTLKDSLKELDKLKLARLRKIGKILEQTPAFLVMGGKTALRTSQLRKHWEGRRKK